MFLYLYEYNIYDTLSFLYDYKYNLINWVNNRLISKFNRTTNIIYYDVTNLLFEIEEPDEEIDDLRKNGVCKEQRKQPIVQMALFMDEQGMTISIETFPGNTLDHLTLKQALNKTIKDLKLILDSFDINIPLKLFRKMELHNIKTSIKVI